MNLIILTENDRVDENHFRLNDYRFEHIRDILKLEIGDCIEIGLLNDGKSVGTIRNINDTNVLIAGVKFDSAEPIEPTIDLICALPRPQTLKKVLFIAGMMNAKRLSLIRAKRVEKSFYHSPLLQQGNLEKHLIDGMMQGKVTRLPIVEIYDRFKPFIEDELIRFCDDRCLKLLPDLETNCKLTDIVIKGNNLLAVKNSPLAKEDRPLAGPIAVAIGPEGGWVPFEIELMEKYGFKKISLGRWNLRVEHAVMAVLSQIEMLKGRS